MPPNKKGGKGYRKGKHGGEQEAQMLEWDEPGGQMPGRVLKKLGDRRFRIYCNDNKERVCKLCGSMRKSDWVEEGAIVILGTREVSNVTSAKTQSNMLDIGDILAVVDPTLYGKFKKLPTINPHLFTSIETQDIKNFMKKVGEGKEDGEEDTDIFDRSGERNESEEKEGEGEEGEEGEEEVDEETAAAKRKEKEKKRDAERGTRRDAKRVDSEDANGNINIDAI